MRMARICYSVLAPWSKKKIKEASLMFTFAKHLRAPTDDDTLKRRAMLMALAKGGEVRAPKVSKALGVNEQDA
jgi:hypothetical protein